MSKLRFDVVQDAFKKKAVPAESPAERTSKYFGELVFNRENMHKYLDSKTYEALIDCIDNGHQLNRAIADEVAEGMKTWAMEHGVTHITHWFQPLTEGTAEKHDSLMEYDGKGGMPEASVPRSRLEAILHGTLHRPYSFRTIRSVFQRSSSLIQVRHSTIRPR